MPWCPPRTQNWEPSHLWFCLARCLLGWAAVVWLFREAFEATHLFSYESMLHLIVAEIERAPEPLMRAFEMSGSSSQLPMDRSEPMLSGEPLVETDEQLQACVGTPQLRERYGMVESHDGRACLLFEGLVEPNDRLPIRGVGIAYPRVLSGDERLKAELFGITLER